MARGVPVFGLGALDFDARVEKALRAGPELLGVLSKRLGRSSSTVHDALRRLGAAGAIRKIAKTGEWERVPLSERTSNG